VTRVFVVAEPTGPVLSASTIAATAGVVCIADVAAAPSPLPDLAHARPMNRAERRAAARLTRRSFTRPAPPPAAHDARGRTARLFRDVHAVSTLPPDLFTPATVNRSEVF